MPEAALVADAEVGPFTALVVRTADPGRGAASFRTLLTSDLPPGDVLVRVDYSSLNYKDALGVTGRGKILRHLPIVPGIDLAGEVVASTAAGFAPGDRVLCTGWGIGETHWGGYARYARLKSDWLVPLPDSLTARAAMVIGTAGLTAMLAVMALEDHGLTPAGVMPETPGEPGPRDVAVTGAAGGVGSVAVALLAAAGYRVVASTGRTEEAEYLRELGAAEVQDRADLSAGPAHPLESARWAGAVDAVGGTTLATLLAGAGRHASIASCGLAGGHELATTVYPFILRGVNLLGIDSNTCPVDRRRAAWERLAQDLPAGFAEHAARIEPLQDIFELAKSILAGGVRGRIVLDVSRPVPGAPEGMP